MIELEGTVTIDRRIARHPLWLRKPFSDGHAMLDLFVLANNRAGEMEKRGIYAALERGQCGWSELGLADRWGWSRTKVRGFLTQLEKRGTISRSVSNLTTVITLTNYDTYNPDSGVFSDEKNTRRTPEEQQKDTEGERGRGIGNPPDENSPSRGDVPDEAEVLAKGRAFAGDISLGIPAGVPERWSLDWLHNRTRPGRPPMADWEAEYVRDFKRDFRSRHPKALGQGEVQKKNGGAATDGQTPAQLRYRLDRERERLEAEVNAARTVGTDWRPALAQLERVEGEIAALAGGSQ